MKLLLRQFLSSVLMLLTMVVNVGAQNAPSAETGNNSGKMDIVYWVVLIIFGGISLTLVVLERRLNKLERRR